jgi:hypothetical protein
VGTLWLMLRLKPLAWWVLPWGLLAGMIVTLLFLGQMAWKPLTDCGQRTSFPYSQYSPPGGCSTIEEGYPVRFLSTAPLLEQNPGIRPGKAEVDGAPVISKAGLAEDWLVWSVISCLVLYMASARRKTGEQAQAPDLVASG